MKYFHLFIFLLIANHLLADSLSVSGFREVPNDISAIQHQRLDANDKACSLIKINSDLDGLYFDSGVRIVGDIEKKSGEYWIYLSPGERRLSIWGADLLKYHFNFPVVIKPGVVYQMVVTRHGADGVGGLTTGFILLKSHPSHAKVWVEDEYMGYTPFTMETSSGYYEYRLEKEMFHSIEGDFTVKVNETETHEMILNPNFGSLSVKSSPRDGAKISLDGVPTNYSTPHTFDTLKSGSHTISLSLELYEPASREVSIKDGESTPMNFEMNPVFGNVHITTNLAADIYIDGERKASGAFDDILRKGVHTIEVKKDKHYSQTRKIDMKAGATETLTFTILPINGSLSIASDPPEAEIFIDGKSYGLTPKIIPEIIIGTSEITLKKANYATVKTTAEVKENERTTVNEDLSNFKEITITSNPSGASLYLNGKNEGTTSRKLTTNFGKNTIRLKRTGYNDFEDSFSVSEQQNTYNFTMVSDQKVMAQIDFDKYKKRKNIWLTATLATATTGAFFAYASDKAGKDYPTATTEATKLYDRMERNQIISYAAFGASGFCAIMTIINASKQSKAKKRMDISAVPLDGGAMLSLQISF
ncbi:MAG TPA: PEGA domain-containing protein [Bacteroidales bacterium]|nr:PEGA domain-containing protein [Bacteroidales bacterium]